MLVHTFFNLFKRGIHINIPKIHVDYHSKRMSITKTDLLRMFPEIITFYSENREIQIGLPCRQIAEF
jgi:hypothetical protein